MRTAPRTGFCNAFDWSPRPPSVHIVYILFGWIYRFLYSHYRFLYSHYRFLYSRYRFLYSRYRFLYSRYRPFHPTPIEFCTQIV